MPAMSRDGSVLLTRRGCDVFGEPGASETGYHTWPVGHVSDLSGCRDTQDAAFSDDPDKSETCPTGRVRAGDGAGSRRFGECEKMGVLRAGLKKRPRLSVRKTGPFVIDDPKRRIRRGSEQSNGTPSTSGPARRPLD